jgi:hypothetical protein
MGVQTRRSADFAEQAIIEAVQSSNARHWCVRRVLRDSVELDPSNNTAGLEISYGGAGAALDATVIEEMLRVIEGGG